MFYSTLFFQIFMHTSKGMMWRCPSQTLSGVLHDTTSWQRYKRWPPLTCSVCFLGCLLTLEERQMAQFGQKWLPVLVSATDPYTVQMQRHPSICPAELLCLPCDIRPHSTPAAEHSRYLFTLLTFISPRFGLQSNNINSVINRWYFSHPIHVPCFTL